MGTRFNERSIIFARSIQLLPVFSLIILDAVASMKQSLAILQEECANNFFFSAYNEERISEECNLLEVAREGG